MAEGEGSAVARELSTRWQESEDVAVDLYQYLATHVPRIYCTDLEPQATEEEEQASSFLLQPLEWYLFGEDPQIGLEKLQQSSGSPQLCGRVFKEGETTYSCRDCAIDPTCVLCMDCFQNSVHKNHRYKMHSSSGGGFCDCGDREAWKTGPSCKKHEPGAEDNMETCAEDQLDADMLERVQMLFHLLLKYTVDMLVWVEGKELPVELQPSTVEDTYYCVLYNDEHHSFDHVIYSLQKAVSCNQREAHNHTSLIDKEGRRAVKRGSIQACEDAKQAIRLHSENISLQPLRVEILHSAAMAHQSFALRLGTWFQQIVGYSAAFRQLFCQVALQNELIPENHCLISRLMLYDSKLYKGARKIVHELIVCSLLMEIEYKRLFAIEFAKHYKQLQQDFIADDHERSISVTALSVQIFTVPTLARQLIEEVNVIKVIIDTLMDMLKEHLDRSNRFHFQGYNSEKFFRIQVVFHDLKYILISKPNAWTEKLRQQFIEGFEAFLGMLTCMQGMEEVKRQFGQHIEVEPEWEAGFSIQIQLRHILSMFQDWCCSDEEVLLQSFRKCYNTLMMCTNQPFKSEAADSYMCYHVLNCKPYRVSQDPVSIHLPISRLLAGLYIHLCRTEAFNRLHEYMSAELDILNMVEYPLRCLVLAAQVAAEMWKRNGLSLVSQVYYYQDVKCRDEMYDKDIIMLQVAAAKMEPNSFVMLVLQRFELFDYFSGISMSRDKDLVKQLNRLTEEMLNLLIILIGERFVPGISNVTKEDVITREVLHLLCIEPMAHSSLVKALPENENNETGLENVITRVATFKKPGVSGHGVYELKNECLKDFNPYFYHYSKSQHSKAEDAQKRRWKMENSDKALPPPVPPRFCPAFVNVVSVLSCDVLLHLLKFVLQKPGESTGKMWTEAMIQMALHLIALGLLEEKQQLETSPEQEVAFNFSLKARRESDHCKSLLSLVENLKAVPALEAQKDMITWTLQMFETVKCLHEKSCFPVTVRCDVSKSDDNSQEKEKSERKRKAEAAKLHRQKIMAQMSAMQKNFIETHKMLYDRTPESQGLEESLDPDDNSPTVLGDSRVALGPKRGTGIVEREVLTCILCQEEQEVRAEGSAMVLTACVQRSAVLTQCRGRIPLNTDSYDPLFIHPDLSCGAHTGSCGHVMHAYCWQKYFEAEQTTTRSRLHAELIFDLKNGEYLCPLCKSLCNTVIPLIPMETCKFNYENAELVGQMLSISRWLDMVLARIKGLQATGQVQDDGVEPTECLFSANNSGDYRSILSFGVQPLIQYSESIKEMLGVCSTAAYRIGLNVVPNDLDPRVPVMSWNTCAFTIQAIENVLHEEEKPLFGSLQNRQHAGLKALVYFSSAQRVMSSQAVIQKHFSRLLAVLVQGMNIEGTPSILDVDHFHLLVGLILAVPALYQENVNLQPSPVSSAFNHLYILHLVTMAHIVQILLSSNDDSGMDSDEEGNDSGLASELYLAMMQCTEGLRDLTGCCITHRVRTGILSFLRCAALFFNFLTGVPPPEDLSNKAAVDVELEALCTYLALPINLFQLFHDYKDTVTTLLPRWCGNALISSALREERSVIRHPRKRNKLIELPEDYSCLLNQACHFKCPRSADDEKKHPTLCLFCGAMLCSQSPCCQEMADEDEVGACTAHSLTCGAGVGMFLRIRECEVILLSNKTRGCIYPAPYLDDYGETDPRLRRGNPLHLSPERYKKLCQLWQQHCIMEEIARSLEVVNVMLTLEWQLL
uniref:E3 ubiquitin-protein ligase n=1 Tax=Erpetoichthys calabaricus TaxID=27687 RepID=A0A8C4XDW1_ERPCA